MSLSDSCKSLLDGMWERRVLHYMETGVQLSEFVVTPEQYFQIQCEALPSFGVVSYDISGVRAGESAKVAVFGIPLRIA